MDKLQELLAADYNLNDRILWINQLNYTYSTVVRHPLERVKSHFYYHRERKIDPNHRWAAGKQLEEWVGFMEDSKDCAVSYLAGVRSNAWWNEGDDAVGQLLPHREYESEPRSDWVVTWDHYVMARRNLMRMGWVGVFEKLQESMDQLRYFWGMKRTKMALENKNKRKPKNPLTQEEIDKILAFNMGDVWLSELAVVLFQQQEVAIKYVS